MTSLPPVPHTPRMTPAPEPDRSSVLTRATDGVGDRGAFDVRTWRNAYGPRGEAGLWLAGVLVAAFVWQMFNGGPLPWGLSGQAMAEGRLHTLASHMFVHGGVAHLMMNLGGLMALTGVVMGRFGRGTGAWLRYLLLFGLSGLSGAALYLALHPAGVVPMVGASGAICGLWGAAARYAPDGGVAPLRSAQVRRNVVPFVQMNVILFLILFALVRLSGGVGGLAWEAHLGGFLFGLLLGPWFAPRPRDLTG